jgi:hypothetical protein
MHKEEQYEQQRYSNYNDWTVLELRLVAKKEADTNSVKNNKRKIIFAFPILLKLELELTIT